MPSHANDVDDCGALTSSDRATPASVIGCGGVAAQQPVPDGRLDVAGVVAGRRGVVPVGVKDDVEQGHDATEGGSVSSVQSCLRARPLESRLLG